MLAAQTFGRDTYLSPVHPRFEAPMMLRTAALLAIVALGSVGCAQRGAEAPENVSLSSSAPAWASQVAVGEPEMTFEERQVTSKRSGGVQQSLRASRSAQPTK